MKSAIFAFGMALCLAPVHPAEGQDSPLQVCATSPELGSIVRSVGGDQVTVTVFTKPGEDPHYVEAKPGFIKSLSQADALVIVGMDQETAYLSVLLQNCRNDRVLRNAPGYMDCSGVITPTDVPTGVIDRSMGDIHPLGNPHYLLDPLNGLKVARLIAEKFSALRPAYQKDFQERHEAFRSKLGEMLVGAALAQKHKTEFEKLAELHLLGKLGEFLKKEGGDKELGGWIGSLMPHAGVKAVDDHNMWPYFARRFGIVIIGHLEPKPGISPTTKHLGQLIDQMKAQKAALILTSAYYDPSHAQFVARNTGAKVLTMANQAGARPGTEDYLAMIDYNVRLVAGAFEGR